MEYYLHYKNKPYHFLGLVRHSETLEEMVLYKTKYENKLGPLWVRPKEMFFESIDVGGKKTARFQKVKIEVEGFWNLKSISQEIQEFLSQGKDSKALLKKLHSVKRNLLFVTARANEKIIGLRLGFLKDDSRFFHCITLLHPQFRGMGLNQLLWEGQKESCLAKGVEWIQTAVNGKAINKITFHLRQGFGIHGLGDRIVMEKRIGSNQ